MNYDIIGDIHGHADELRALLKSMGYREHGSVWRHTDRHAVFVGDLIDRGPNQVETVEIVCRMIDADSAIAVMGNHELNAIAWYLPDPCNACDFLRSHYSPEHGKKNREQHQAFLREVEGTQKHKEIIEWFLTLPLWLELDGIRVVHACWHQRFIDDLSPKLAVGNRLNETLMLEATREPKDEKEKDTPHFSVFKAVEAITKGIEIPLPHPHSFRDKEGHVRRRVRTRWWDSEARTYRQTAILKDSEREALPDELVPDHFRIGHYGTTPIFVGHYWLTGSPALLSDKAACVDYSVAKGGRLMAYRWDGEPILSSSKFHWVGK